MPWQKQDIIHNGLIEAEEKSAKETVLVWKRTVRAGLTQFLETKRGWGWSCLFYLHTEKAALTEAVGLVAEGHSRWLTCIISELIFIQNIIVPWSLSPIVSNLPTLTISKYSDFLCLDMN